MGVAVEGNRLVGWSGEQMGDLWNENRIEGVI